MLKKLFFFLLSTSILIADSYNFTELRYSDATGRYGQLEGKISFYEDGLNIKYPKFQRELDYRRDVLLYLEKGEKIDLDDSQSEQIMRYFDVLRLLHSGDDSELQDMFEVEITAENTLLRPVGSIKYYIKQIELTKDKKKLKYVKLFLKNNDNISIKIDDEIR